MSGPNDGFITELAALLGEHHPRTAEEWRAIAQRCVADVTYDPSWASPLFAALYAAERELSNQESSHSAENGGDE